MMKSMLTVEENKKKELVFLLKTKPVVISAIESKMSDDPEAAPDLLDVLDDILEASDEIQAELAVIKQKIIFHLKNMKRMLQMTKKMKQ